MENLFHREAVRMSTLTNLSHLTKGAKNHLRNVYTCLTMSLVCAASGAYINMKHALIGANSILSLFLMIGFIFYLHSVPHNRQNLNKRLGVLGCLSLFIGASMGPLLDLVIRINPAIVVTAFAGTSGIFACFTVSALLAKRRTYLYLGGVLSSVSMILLVTLFIGVHSLAAFKLYLYAATALTLGFILYDTQLIIEKYMSGDDDYVIHSVNLFFDFVRLFQQILTILALNDEDKKNKRK